MKPRAACILSFALAALSIVSIANAQQDTVEIYHDTDFVFHDVTRLDGSTLEKCIEACRDNDKCVAFTLSPAGSCYLKDGVGTVTRSSSATSGFLTTRGTPPKQLPER